MIAFLGHIGPLTISDTEKGASFSIHVYTGWYMYICLQLSQKKTYKIADTYSFVYVILTFYLANLNNTRVKLETFCKHIS
jgi:hypothetical protein